MNIFWIRALFLRRFVLLCLAVRLPLVLRVLDFVVFLFLDAVLLPRLP